MPRAVSARVTRHAQARKSSSAARQNWRLPRSLVESDDTLSNECATLRGLLESQPELPMIAHAPRRNWRLPVVSAALLVAPGLLYFSLGERSRTTSQEVRLRLVAFSQWGWDPGRPLAGATVSLEYDCDPLEPSGALQAFLEPGARVADSQVPDEWTSGTTDANGSVRILLSRTCRDATWSNEPPSWRDLTGKYYRVRVTRPQSEVEFSIQLTPNNWMIVNPGNMRDGFDAQVTLVDKPKYCEPSR